MARRRDKAQAETFEIVEGVVERMDFQFAAVAGAGIDLADRQAAAQPPARGAIDLRGEFGQRRVVRGRRRLGQRPRAGLRAGFCACRRLRGRVPNRSS